MRHVEVTLLYVSPDGESEEITYARMTELIESGDFRAFKVRISSEDGSLVREETIEQKLEAVFPFIPARILRAVSKAINFIIRIFTKK